MAFLAPEAIALGAEALGVGGEAAAGGAAAGAEAGGAEAGAGAGAATQPDFNDAPVGKTTGSSFGQAVKGDLMLHGAESMLKGAVGGGGGGPQASDTGGEPQPLGL